jgi:hypothetical protein
VQPTVAKAEYMIAAGCYSIAPHQLMENLQETRYCAQLYLATMWRQQTDLCDGHVLHDIVQFSLALTATVLFLTSALSQLRPHSVTPHRLLQLPQKMVSMMTQTAPSQTRPLS